MASITSFPTRPVISCWTSCIALIHACSDSVRAGTIDPGEAARILRVSVRDLFTGTPGR